jgi:predicted nucleic acid-binding Zn ribbon protein
MSNTAGKSSSGDDIKEVTSELKEKLKRSFSRFLSMRSYITLKPTMSCSECEGSGKTLCSICHGTGKMILQFTDREAPCDICEGTGKVTCSECGGSGILPNIHRKKILVILIVGAFAWIILFVSLYLSSHDLLPAQRAQWEHLGGGASKKPVPPAVLTPNPAVQNPMRPGTVIQQSPARTYPAAPR